jgi:tRNA A-37 threonylcarbamoyl transferase component Bud32
LWGENLFRGDDLIGATPDYLASDIQGGELELRVTTGGSLRCRAYFEPKDLEPKDLETADEQERDFQRAQALKLDEERHAVAREICELLEESEENELRAAKKMYREGNLVKARETAKGIVCNTIDCGLELRQRAERLAVRCSCELGVRYLGKNSKRYCEAALCFEEALQDAHLMSVQRAQTIHELHACSLYEAAKQLRNQTTPKWHEAQKLFCETKKHNLPERLRGKLERYAIECELRCTEVKEDLLHDLESLEEWLMVLFPTNEDAAAAYAAKFRDAGYDQVNDLLNIEARKEVDNFIMRTEGSNHHPVLTVKDPHRRKIWTHLSLRRWKHVVVTANMHLSAGRYPHAKKCYQMLVDADLTKPYDLSETVALIELVETARKRICNVTMVNDLDVSSFVLDQCSKYLNLGANGSQSVSNSVNLDKRYSHFDGKRMLAVLDTPFPQGSEQRRTLLLQLETNMTLALRTLATMKIIDERFGSYIIYFCFVQHPDQPKEDLVELEKEYLRQIEDGDSPLRKADTAGLINKDRTLEMTAELDEQNYTSQRSSRIFVGPTPITLAHFGEWKIVCTVESKLGEGATATVFKIRVDGEARALKVFHSDNNISRLCNEANVLLALNHRLPPEQNFRHPNVLAIDFVWYQKSTNEVIFLLEYCDGDTLQRWMDDDRLYRGCEQHRQQRLISIAHQLASGIQHLHSCGILHQDIKPTNVLMTKDGKPVIADFGASSCTDTRDPVANVVEGRCFGLTPSFASPKVRDIWFKCRSKVGEDRRQFVAQTKATHLDDAWCYAATVFEMYAECGWRRGLSVAEAWIHAKLGSLRVPLPQKLLEVLRDCFSAEISGTLTMESVAKRVGEIDVIGLESDLQEGLEGARCSIIHNHLGLALQFQGEAEQAKLNADEAGPQGVGLVEKLARQQQIHERFL